MNAAQVSDEFLAAMDDALRTTYATPKMGLFTGTPPVARTTTLADLVALAPGFTGYAEKAMTLLPSRRNSNGDYMEPFVSVSFQPSAGGGTLPEIVTGYYVQVQAGLVPASTLWFMEMLPAPFTFTDEFSALSIIFESLAQNATVWGGECAQC